MEEFKAKLNLLQKKKAKLNSIEEEIRKLLRRPDLGTFDVGRLLDSSIELEELISSVKCFVDPFPFTWQRLCLYYYNLESDREYIISRAKYIISRAERMQSEIKSKIDIESKIDSSIDSEFENRETAGSSSRNLTYMDFKCYVGMSLRNIPPMFRNALLGLCGSYLLSQMKINTAPFENSQLKRTTNVKAPPQPLLFTFGEAFEEFFPEITQITILLLCIILTMVLIFRLHSGVQIILCMFLLIPAFFFGLLELAHKASKTGVVCGSIKLPLGWFIGLDAVVISFVFMLATLLLIYFSWMLSKGKPSVEDVDDATLDVLCEAVQGDDHV